MQETENSVSEAGSVRVDLLGGTIDLDPINHILEETVTINMATSLTAKVLIQATDASTVEINSLDYSSSKSIQLDQLAECSDQEIIEKFPNICFVLLIVKFFSPQAGMKIQLSSGSPPGAGLGGSSAMGVTLFKALTKFLGQDQNFDKQQIISIVKNIEAKILNQGVTGYQDYYPALYGGVLALVPSVEKIEVKQLYDQELKSFLKDHLVLIYSGITRNSGINNWEVYKNFFEGNDQTRSGLKEISELSSQALNAIQNKDYQSLLSLLTKEGELREKLFSNIVPVPIKKMIEETQAALPQVLGAKMCGAGGGGCFILILSHPFTQSEQKTFLDILEKCHMQKLELDILEPSR